MAGKGHGRPFPAAQGIEAEIPEQTAKAVCEELERIARFPAHSAGNAPKSRYPSSSAFRK